jgi:predicted PurR-regulated permease PerM
MAPEAKSQNAGPTEKAQNPHSESGTGPAARTLAADTPAYAESAGMDSSCAEAVEARGERRRLNRLQAISEVIIATGVVLAACYYAKLPLIVLLVSVLGAFVLAPFVDFFQKLRLPRSVAALISVLLFLGALYGLFYVSYTRAQGFAQQWPRYEREIRKLVIHVRQTSETIQKTAAGVMPPAPEDKNAIKVQPVTPWASFFSSRLGSLTEIVFEALFIPFLIYFMLTWQEHVRIFSVRLFRAENRKNAYITLGLISSMIRSFITANVLLGLFIGGCSTAVFGILGLQYFYFIGFMSGFLSLVPYFGVVLAVIPPIVVGLGHLNSTGITITVIAVFGLHLFAINVLYPKFLGSRLNLNPLTVTLALLFWEFMWGPMGLILAIPITAAMKIIFDHVERLRPLGAWLGE